MMALTVEAGTREEASAKAASLIYCSDTEPGIERHRAGKGFWYLGPVAKVKDASILERISKLAIPPAWNEVWISPNAKGHIQATGRDHRGRKQYRYHPRWTLYRGEVKYSTLIDFAHALPSLRERIDADLQRHGMPYERVLATIVWLLDNSMIRVGNMSYARDNGSFGLTTLQDKHVDVRGPTLRFCVSWKIRQGMEAPGQRSPHRQNCQKRSGLARPTAFSVPG